MQVNTGSLLVNSAPPTHWPFEIGLRHAKERPIICIEKKKKAAAFLWPQLCQCKGKGLTLSPAMCWKLVKFSSLADMMLVVKKTNF